MKNTSENVLESYKKISEIKKLSLEEVKEKIWKNFLSLSKI
jgi:Tat protein secretion system quality control protein TatD with DNase activity